MKLSIIVPSIGRLLNREWLIRNADKYTIILVNDGDKKDDFFDLGSQITVLNSSQRGFSRACNIGLRHAQKSGHQSCLILNDDAFPIGDCVSILEKANHHNQSLFSPVIYERNEKIYGYSKTSFGRVYPNNRYKEGSLLTGVCLYCPSWVRFDENYIHGFEDFDLSIRILQSGLEVTIVPQAHCFHLGGSSIHRKSPEAQYGSAYGQFRLMGLRKMPFVLSLQLLQVISEGCSPARFNSVFRASVIYSKERATSIASSRAGSSRAK
jgi:GT2 family glycosyltransferase